MNVAYFHNFSQNFIATVRAGYSDARYQGREAAFAEKRHDKTARLALDLIYCIAPIKSELSLSLNGMRDSNFCGQLWMSSAACSKCKETNDSLLAL